MSDILLHPFSTPFESFPFDKITDKDYEPAITELLRIAKEDINSIADNIATPTFENTIDTMENNGKQLGRIVEAFFNVNSANTNEYLEHVAQKIAPELAAFSNDVTLNETLFKRVKQVYDNRENLDLDDEQLRLLDKCYKSFVRNGALLNEEQKTTLREIDQKIAVLKVQFSQNVLQETNNYKIHLTKQEDIAGLPESILQQAKQLAEKDGKDGYLFTLQFPSYVPFMKYAANRNRREELYLAYNKRAFQQNEFNNESIIKQLIKLKHERANLLGYSSYAAFVLEERMARSQNKVTDFLNDLLLKAKPFAVKEIDALKDVAKEDDINDLMPYDHAYYAEKLREAKYDYSEEALKAYFPLQQVLNAAFGLANKLFGLEFEPINNVSIYNEEVAVYNVTESGNHKALFYTDFFPRDGKRAGAWMTSFKGQYIDANHSNSRPHISIVCNFSRPVGEVPSLLTFTEVTTLFHEFGHALHGMLANTKYESLSGTNVYWDFVELPSQFLENFCYEKEFLQTFARHWETGEVLDDATIDKIVKASNFMEGYQTMRQLSFAMLDMAYYSGDMDDAVNIASFEQQHTENTRLYPLIKDTAFSPSFSHIFGGGYDAGYYSYKWAEVLDADAFAFFKENGIFDNETANKYKSLLSKGGTVDPLELYKQFRGREATVDALLERAGLN